MARLPRYIIPGQPQHIIQRGNNRQAIFAAEADYQFFRDALIATKGGVTKGGVRSFIITFAHAILAYMAPPSALLIEPSPRSKLV